MDAVRAFDRACRTIAAAHVADFFSQPSEIGERLMEVARKIVVCQKPQHVCDRHSFGTLPFALVAHAAVLRPDLLVHHIQ